MLKSIKKIFQRIDPIIKIGRSGRSTDFAKNFFSANVIVLSSPTPDLSAPYTITQNKLISIIENTLREISNQTEVPVFTYLKGKDLVFPIFLSQKAAENFVQKYVNELNRVIPFQVMTVSTKILIPKFVVGMQIVLNPKNHDEYVLKDDDINELIKLSS